MKTLLLCCSFFFSKSTINDLTTYLSKKVIAPKLNDTIQVFFDENNFAEMGIDSLKGSYHFVDSAIFFVKGDVEGNIGLYFTELRCLNSGDYLLLGNYRSNSYYHAFGLLFHSNNGDIKIKKIERYTTGYFD